ncbi:hypothetical protein [Natronorubrum sp. FCH18a]|uniref:hypothetical protein n=1 Tax=Natronorubrum sp. FCH18a TaxID=3447018 RepID=UPI003F51AC48
MSAPSSDPDAAPGAGGLDDRSWAFTRHVTRIVDRFDDLRPFVLVPFVLSVFEFESVRRTLDSGRSDFSINVEFALPTPLLDLWSFVDPPDPASAERVPEPAVGPGDGPRHTEPTGSTGSGTTDVTIETPFETVVLPLEPVDGATVAWLGVALVLYAVTAAVIAAGYLGGIDRRLRGEPAAIVPCIVRYTPALLLYYLVLFAAFAGLVPFLVAAPLLVLFVIPLVIVLGYLFYAVPFLMVVDDAEFLEAFRRSAQFALEGGPYATFALGHVAVAVLVSIGLSMVVSTGGIASVAIALVVAAPLAFVLTAATVSLVQELVGVDGFEETTDRPRTGSNPDDEAGIVP